MIMTSSIAKKLIISILAFSFVITLFITGFHIFIDYNSEIKRVSAYEMLIKNTYLDSITTSVWMYDDIQIKLQLDGLLNLPDLDYLIIKSKDGYAWSSGEMKSKRHLIKDFPLIYTQNNMSFEIGTLKAVISLDEIYDRLLNSALVTLAANSVKTFLMAGFILLIFNFFITRHLHSILNWLKNIEIGKSFEKFSLNRSKRYLKSDDELDEIVATINEMQDKLKNYLEIEKRFKRLIDDLQETFFFYKYDNAGNFTYISSSMTAVLGYSEAEIYRFCTGYLIKNKYSVLNDNNRETDGQNKKKHSYEIEIPRSKGTSCYLLITETPVLDKDGELIEVEGLAHDITDRKKIEVQLRQAHKMEAIGTLAGGIAHDFNNILGIIIGYSQLCMDNTIDQPETYVELNEILKAANRARDLVKQILTFSRQTETEKNPININPIVKEIIKFIRASLPSTIEIKSEIHCNNDIVMADPVKMHQLLMNLCVNAGHAMKDSGGILTISLDNIELSEIDITNYPGLKIGSYLGLTVQDTGHGIPKEYLERIFEPYFTTKNKEEGTGLGLAVVHAIVEEHAGKIRVYSEPGAGTTFYILLPLAEAVYGENRKDSLSPCVIPRGNECILLVDDEQSLAAIMRKILESLGYIVVAETNPFDALERFIMNSESFDLLITDKTMPGMPGLELIKQIKKKKKNIPVILTTGLSYLKNKDDSAKGLIDEVLIKPVSTEILSQTIRKILDYYKIRKEEQESTGSG
ncbi:MAG: response regulator [Spirochaetes bacterium]|nr:response regulator [Spirochaetota bacterium]